MYNGCGHFLRTPYHFCPQCINFYKGSKGLCAKKPPPPSNKPCTKRKSLDSMGAKDGYGGDAEI